MFENKTVLLGVTGGIAAYKAAELASLLVKSGAQVDVVMTESACRFVSALTFETLTARPVTTDLFTRERPYEVAHVSLAKRASLLIVAPATANCIAKLAHGIADDMLTTTALACRCPLLIAPAMNTAMLENPATVENLATLEKRGATLVYGDEGRLACGDAGRGRMAEPDRIADAARGCLCPKDLKGRRVLVTAGPTREALDPVRFLSNRSTGRMGCEIARAARDRGAEVLLVCGPIDSALIPCGVRTVRVESAAQMFEAVKAALPGSDIVVKAAAVADFAPESVSGQKLKKDAGAPALSLARTQDILKYIGENRHPGQVVIGFAMETQDLLDNARAKLVSKKADMIVANSLTREGAGFGVDTNVVTLLTAAGAEELGLTSKYNVGMAILDRAARL